MSFVDSKDSGERVGWGNLVYGWMPIDLKSNIVLIPRAASPGRCIGTSAANSADGSIDFWFGLDPSFSVHDTSARPLLHHFF